MTAIEELGAVLARLGGDDIPAVQDKLRLHVVDTIGAWIAACRTAEGRAFARLRAHVPGCDGHSSLLDDVARNCALARLSEVDDIHLASMTTPGSIVIPAALTIVPACAARDAEDVAAAIVAGYEAMMRLGLAVNGPEILYRGIWPTYLAAPFGVAAVASRLLRLDAGQTAHALALALTLAAPGVGHHNAPTTSRWVALGNAARNGLSAALAAQSGFTADVKLLESGFFANVYGITPRVSAMTEHRGGKPMVGELSLKPWCAARQTMAATQALREIMQDGVCVDEIVAIKVAVLPPHRKMIDHGVVAGDRASYLTSLQYHMAVAALAPAAALDLAPSAHDLSPAMGTFMARVEVASDDALLADYPAAWPARVSVVTTAGTRDRLVTDVPGDPRRPFGEADLADKLRHLITPVLGDGEANTLLNRSLGDLLGRYTVSSLLRAVNQTCDAPMHDNLRTM